MWTDSIVDDVRAAREAYAKRFVFDIRKIGKDLQKKQKAPLKSALKAAPPVKRRKTSKKRRAE